MKRIAFGSDHVGVGHKAALVEWARRTGHAVEDCGAYSTERVDYPDFAARAVHALAAGRCDTVVLVCGSGVGMAIAANRFPVARAVVGHSVAEVALARGHNDVNVLCLGSRVTSESDAIAMLQAFLTTPHDGGRHRGRVALLSALGARQVAVRSSPAIDFAPGPTEMADDVYAALAAPMPHHKSAEFGAMVDTVTGRLRRLVDLTDGHLLLVTAAGTGVIESAFWNLCAEGDRVVVLTNGYFGDRIATMAGAQGLAVRVIESGWTEPLALDRLAASLDDGVAAVFMVHLESSTGQVNDIRAVSAITRASGVPLVVDAVSSLGALPLSFPDQGFDVLVSSTQKGLAAPPGIGIVAFTDAVWERAHRRSRSLYFSWDRAIRSATRSPAEMQWTPPIPLVAALCAASDRWQNAAAVARRHRILAEMCALDFRPYLPAPVLRAESPVHAFHPPSHLIPRQFRAAMAKAGWFIAGGLGELDGKIVRVASYHDTDPDEFRLAAFLRDVQRCASR